jgi:hypothetical protein
MVTRGTARTMETAPPPLYASLQQELRRVPHTAPAAASVARMDPPVQHEYTNQRPAVVLERNDGQSKTHEQYAPVSYPVLDMGGGGGGGGGGGIPATVAERCAHAQVQPPASLHTFYRAATEGAVGATPFGKEDEGRGADGPRPVPSAPPPSMQGGEEDYSADGDSCSDDRPYNENKPVAPISDQEYVQVWGTHTPGSSAMRAVGNFLRSVPGAETVRGLAGRITLTAPTSLDMWRGKIRLSASQHGGAPDVPNLVGRGLPVNFWRGITVGPAVFATPGDRGAAGVEGAMHAPASAYGREFPAGPMATLDEEETGTLVVTADDLYEAACAFNTTGYGRLRHDGTRENVFLDVLIRAGVTLRHLHMLGVCWEDVTKVYGLLAHHLRDKGYMDPYTLRSMQLYPPSPASGSEGARHGVNLDVLLSTVPGLKPDRLLDPPVMGGIGANAGMIANLHAIPPLHCETPLKCLIHRGLTPSAFSRAPFHSDVWEILLGLTRSDLVHGLSLRDTDIALLANAHGWTATRLHETYGMPRNRLVRIGIPVPQGWLPRASPATGGGSSCKGPSRGWEGAGAGAGEGQQLLPSPSQEQEQRQQMIEDEKMKKKKKKKKEKEKERRNQATPAPALLFDDRNPAKNVHQMTVPLLAEPPSSRREARASPTDAQRRAAIRSMKHVPVARAITVVVLPPPPPRTYEDAPARPPRPGRGGGLFG